MNKITKTLIGITGLSIIIGIVVGINSNSKPYPDAHMKSPTTTFKANEALTFTINLKNTTISIIPFIKSAEAAVEPEIEVNLLRQNQKVEIEGMEIVKNSTDEYTVTIPQQTSFMPGSYTLQALIYNGVTTQELTKDFSWGVIAVNTNKSIYKPHEKVYIQMGVLDETGKTLCNADIKLTVKSPNGEIEEFSTKDKTIIKSPECRGDSYTSVPDYWSNYTLGKEEGIYEMQIKALTKNGEKTISDYFEVVENINFDIERIGPTRIYPPAPYEYQIKIKANDDFSGVISEKVPGSFEITNNTPSQFKFNQSVQNDVKTLSWAVNMKKGEMIELSYNIKFPRISPEFYLLGPLGLLKNNKIVFQEKRSWQIASDAVFTFIAHRGAANTKSSGTTLSLTPSSNIIVGRVAVIRAVSDNIQTTDGTSTLHTISDDSGNTWTKVKEHTFGGGAAGAGVTVSLWASHITTTITTSDNITLTTGSSVDAKGLSVDEFSLPADYTLEVVGNAGDQGTGTSPTTNLSGLSSSEYLWLGAVGIEGPSGDSFTQDSDYTTLTSTGTTGGSVDSNITIRGGYRDYTGTGDTYNVTADNRGVIEFIGSSSGVNSATLPSHQADDLILAFSYRDGSTTAPSLVSPWTNIGTAGGANTNSSRLAYYVATDSATLSGTWTSATSVVFHVYRGADTSSPIGDNGNTGSTGTTVTYPTLTMSISDGSSWVAGFAGHRSTNTSLEDAPLGMINRENVNDATDEASGHDTDGGVTSWSNTNVSVGGTSSGWRARTVEVKAAAINRDWAAISAALRGAPPVIDVSGRIYTDEGSTSLNCSTPRLVRIRVNGSEYTDTTNCTNSPSNGSYSFTGVEIPSIDSVITVYLDGESENATMVTQVADASSNLINIDLYQNRIIVRHENTGPSTNTTLDAWDSGNEGDGIDGDIGYTVTSGNLTVSNTRKLLIWSGDTFTPGGTITTNAGGSGVGGDIQTDSSATLSMGSNALSIGGSYTNSGTLTLSSGHTTTFTSTGSETINPGASNFQNLTFNGTGGDWTTQSTLNVDSNLTVTNGALYLLSNMIVGSSGVTNSGNITINTNCEMNQGLTYTTTILSSSGGSAAIQNSGTISFYNLTIAPAVASAPTITLGPWSGDPLAVANDFTVGNGTNPVIVDAETYDPDIDMQGSFTVETNATFNASSTGGFLLERDFTVNGTFNANSGRVEFEGLFPYPISTISGSGTPAVTFYDLAIQHAGKEIRFTAGQTFQINGMLTISGTSVEPIKFNSTSNGNPWTINHQGTESISYLYVKDSACHISSTDISVGTTSIDGGNNGACWLFEIGKRIVGTSRIQGPTRIK